MTKTAAGEGPVERVVMQHTPGPWYVTTADEWRTANGEHAQWGRFDISAGSNDQTSEKYYRVASVSNVNNSEQNQANAKLIAAAPRMLKALKWAETMVLQHCRNEDGQTPDVTPIRQAIDEAEGRK